MTAHRFVHALTYDEKHASIWEMCFNTDDNSLIIFGFESVSIGMQSRAPSQIPLPSEPLSQRMFALQSFTFIPQT